MPARPIECLVPDASVPLIVAGKVFVIVDDGRLPPRDYSVMAEVFLEHARQSGAGLICLVIVPPDARAPDEEVRTAIRAAFRSVTDHVAAVCWVVEGAGFKGATARAVLSGLRLLLNAPYPTHVTPELRAALAWSLARSGESSADDRELTGVAHRIAELRAAIARPAPSA